MTSAGISDAHTQPIIVTNALDPTSRDKPGAYLGRTLSSATRRVRCNDQLKFMIIKNDSEYRAYNALNFSSLKSILASPRHYQAALKAPKKEPSKAMFLGTMVHSRCLEKREENYAVMPPDLDGRTKEGKAWKEANAGKTCITQDEYAQYKRMVGAVEANADVQYLLSKAVDCEIGIVQKYRETTIKGKIDCLIKDENGKYAVLDLKTTQSCDPHEFSRSACSFKYFMQAVWYQSLVALEYELDYQPPYYWLTVENSEAADVCIFQPPADGLELGQKQMEKALELHAECTKSGKWQGFGNGIIELDVPIWEKRKYGLI